MASLGPDSNQAHTKTTSNPQSKTGSDAATADCSYTILEKQLTIFKEKYPFIEVGIAGKSVMGKNIYYIRLGRGSNQVFYNAAHHANEWITTLLLMEFIKNFAGAYAIEGHIRAYDISDIWNRSSIYVIPLVNPDGVDLVNYWPDYKEPLYHQATQLNTTGQPLATAWKANIRGVDLNLNYPADWEKEHQLEIQRSINGPAPRDYGGPTPLSEPETIAMVKFTKTHDFQLVIAFHTQGEEIYYQYENLAPPESLKIAQMFSRVSGYPILQNPADASYAGYKDWFIQEYGRPGFTIEAGIGVNPIPVSQLPTIYQQNEEILLLGALV